ncbi:MAG: right-handed parallel beta-helix repeat-containing protein [Fidelibacterota bacterium]
MNRPVRVGPKAVIFFLGMFLLSCESILTPGGGGEEDTFDLTHDFEGGPKLTQNQPITLSWSQITFARFERYTVERSVLKDGEEVWSERKVITDPLVTTWTDTLDDDEIYRYRVRMIGAGGETDEAITERIIIRTTSITVPDEIECLQEAFDSPFIDDGDTLHVNPPTPCTVTNPLKFIGKDVLIESVAGREKTVVNRPGTLLTMNRGVLRGFTFVRGGVHLSGTAVMEDCEVTNGYGGESAVVVEDSAEVRDCVVSGNTRLPWLGETAHGAGMTVKDHARVLRTRISRNRAWNRGGGLALYGQPTIMNSIIDHNEAANGGGGILIGELAEPVIVNCVLFGNESGLANGDLGAVYMKKARPTYLNTIVWGNSSWSQEDRLWRSASYSDIQGYREGTGNISASPRFVDSSSGDFRLLPGSPCIDAGHPGSEYKDPDGSRNDMGAYGGPWGDW